MGATQTRLWDAVDHLRVEEDMIVYIDAVLAEYDAELMIAALHDIARAWGKAAVAADAGLVGEGHCDGTPASTSPEFGAVLKPESTDGFVGSAVGAGWPLGWCVCAGWRVFGACGIGVRGWCGLVARGVRLHCAGCCGRLR